MKKGLIIAIIGGAAAYGIASSRKSKKSKKGSSKSSPDEVVDSGIGYAKDLGFNVEWAIVRTKGAYIWAWESADGTTSVHEGVPFKTEEEAFAALQAATGLQALPKPDPLGEGEVPPLPEPPVPPSPPRHLVPGMGLGTLQPPGPVPEPPLFNVDVYPAGGDKTKLPGLTDAAGMVVSEDCQVAGVGPMFWDEVGNSVEGLQAEGVESADEMLQLLAGTYFPMAEIHLCPGAHAIYIEMEKRVNDFLAE